MFQRLLSVTVLSCLTLINSAQDPPESPSLAVECSVGGKTWTDGFTYLTGQAGVFPSIYAECNNGVTSCYRQTRVRDVARDHIECNESEIHELRRRLGIYAPKQDMRWPEGVICYNYKNSGFSAEERGVFTKAMDEYHEKTNVMFIDIDQCRTKYGEKTKVCDGCKYSFDFVSRQNACFATLGYKSDRPSTLNFGASCFREGHHVAVHELGHITGLFHEHMHPKREVVIIREEIRVAPDNYQMMKDAAVTPYDRQSVMHYRRDGGMCIPKDLKRKYCDIIEKPGLDGCVVPTASDCDPSQDKSFGYAQGLAVSDIETIAKMYGSKQGGAASNGSNTTTSAPATTAPPSSTPTTTTPTTTTPATTTPTTPDLINVRTFVPRPPVVSNPVNVRTFMPRPAPGNLRPFGPRSASILSEQGDADVEVEIDVSSVEADNNVSQPLV